MKTKTLLISFFLVSAIMAKGQDFIPGYEFGEAGTLYLSASDSVKGFLVFSFIKNNEVTMIAPPEKGKDTKYKAADILGFRLNDSKLDFVSGKAGLGKAAFLQVITPEFNQAKVVKTFIPDVAEKVEAGKTPKGSWYISLYLADQKTNFEGTKKLAEVVKPQCPVLAGRMASKEKGYFVNLMSSEEESVDSFKRIATEIEAGCK